MQLRDYQVRAVADAARLHCEGKRRILIVAPTGSGKTVLAGNMIRRSFDKGRRIAFLAHRRKLIDQSCDKFVRFGIPHAAIMRGRAFAPDVPVQVASVQTLVRRVDQVEPFDLIFVDEAHHVRGSSYVRIIEASPNATIIGLTATPCRLDGKELGDFFDSMVVVAQPGELVEQGWLVRDRIFAPYVPSMAGVKKTGGDYNIAQLRTLMDQTALVGNIVMQWKRHGAGRPTVAFCVGVEHSKRVRDSFLREGIPAAHIDAGTPDELREEHLERLNHGEDFVLCNVGVLTEGWDRPCTSCCILARPTASLGLHLQMGGRVLRPWEGKDDALILDHAGNCLRHGSFTEPRQWSLERKQKRKTRDEHVPSLRQCPVCYRLWPPSRTECECGHVWEVDPPEIAEIEGELRETESILVILARNPALERKVVYWTGCERLRKENGYKPGWSMYRFKDEFDYWPTKDIKSLSAQYARAQERSEDQVRGTA